MPHSFEPIERDVDPAIAAVSALSDGTFKHACVTDWRLDGATLALCCAATEGRPGAGACLAVSGLRRLAGTDRRPTSVMWR